MLHASFEQLHAAGCIQTGADVEKKVEAAKPRFEPMFNALQVETHGNMCAGCPAYNDGKCAAFKQYHSQPNLQARSRQARIDLHTKPKGTESHPGKSIGQIAKDLGISKSEVRRRKLAGTL